MRIPDREALPCAESVQNVSGRGIIASMEGSTIIVGNEQLLADNGADVILGSHSHRVGEVERRTVQIAEGVEKECVIAYSLGDFCVTEPGKTTTSIALNLEFSKEHSTGRRWISDLSYTPISTVHSSTGPDLYHVVATEEAVSQYEANYYLRVEEAAYDSMVKDLEKLGATVFPPTEEDTE